MIKTTADHNKSLLLTIACSLFTLITVCNVPSVVEATDSKKVPYDYSKLEKIAKQKDSSITLNELSLEEHVRSSDMIRGDIRQIADDLAQPLPPELERTKEQTEKTKFMARTMQARVLQKKGNFKGALKAYQKAVTHYPKNASVYKVMFLLAIELKQVSLASEYAQKAVELNPNDYTLLRELGRFSLRANNLNEALKFFEKAAQSEDIDRKSGTYVILNMELAELYTIANKPEKVAKCLEVVFNGLQKPKEYNLSARERSRLLAKPTQLYERMGQAFLAAEKYELAQKAFERSSQSGLRDKEVLGYNSARVLTKQGFHKKALAQLDIYFNSGITSKGTAPYNLLSEVLLKLDQSDQLIPKLKSIILTSPKNIPAKIFLAKRLEEKDELDSALKLYQETLVLRKTGEAYLGVARIYRLQKKADLLLSPLSLSLTSGAPLGLLDTELELLSKDKEFADTILAASKLKMVSNDSKMTFAECFLAGQLAKRMKDTKDVVVFYEAAIRKQPRRDASLYRELGVYLMREKEYAKSIKVFQDAVDQPDLVSTRPLMLYLLSEAYRLNSETDKAITAIQRVREIDPETSDWAIQEALIYSFVKQWENAINVYEKFIADFEDDPKKADIVRNMKFSLSSVYVQSGQQRKGEEILELVYNKNPDDPSVNNDLGYLYADANRNLDKAKKMIEIAIKAEPENAAYLDSMGWVLYRLKQYEKAITYLEDAAKKRPEDAVLLDHLADCYHGLGKTKEALENWTLALKFAEKSIRPDVKLINSIKEKIQKHSK